jgi:hypothetical protein
MKKAILIICSFMLMATFSCEDQPVPPKEEPDTNLPSSAVPASFKGDAWFWGTISALSHFDPNGNNLGRDWEAGRQIEFYEENGKGRMDFNQYLGTRSFSNCITEIYTHKKGTIKFEGQNKYIFYPKEGTVRIVKSGKSSSCAKENTMRPLTKDQLRPDTALYKIEILQDKKYLYVYKATDTEMKSPVFGYQMAK